MNLHFLETKIRKQNTYPVSNRRGSTILLVLAMLSILLLLGIAFSYSTRLESQASMNYAELAQARSSAVSGLPMSLPMLIQASQGITTTLQNWNTVPQTLQKMARSNGRSTGLTTGDMAALNQAGMRVRQNKSGEIDSAPQANITVRDLSGLINLNAVDNQAAMERVIGAILPEDTQRKSAALMALRGDPQFINPNSRSMHGRDEPADLDPRDPNSQMLDSLKRLRFDAQAGQPLFTHDEIEKLSKYVTVFSQAPEMFNGPNGEHIPRIPLDSIDPKHVYDTLRAAFPNKENELLLQFAANVADFSDEDSEPTILDMDGDIVASAANGSANANVTFGVEMTPLISEVYPDAVTSVGFDDDGQFLEIVNPWRKSINLSGWNIRTGGGRSISLTGQLPPGGYLVVTDNYDKPKPDSPTAQGSLVSLFGITADGGARQVITQPSLDLTDRNSRVSLYSPTGQLADIFAYESTGQVDGKQSFQRVDPQVRGVVVAQATPMQPATGGGANSIAAMTAATKAWEDGNTTMTKLSQLFTLSTGFVERNPDGSTIGNDNVHPSQMAELTLPENYNPLQNRNADPYPDNLDLRLVDIFTATPSHTIASEEDLANNGNGVRDNNGKNAYQAFREKMDRIRDRADGDADDAETTVPTVYSFGKLNVNTCPKYALLGLTLDNAQPGSAQAGIVDKIEQFQGHRLRQVQQGKAPFENVSDFLSQFTSGFSRSNLEKLDSITDQVTVGSSAFEIVSTNRLSPDEQKALEDKDSTAPRPATATARWVISTDQKPYSVVSFYVVP